VTGDLIYAVRNLRGARDAAVQRSVDDWLTNSRIRGGETLRPVRTAARTVAARREVGVAVRRTVTRAVESFQGEHDNLHDAYRSNLETLRDEESFFERMSADLSEIMPADPTLAVFAGSHAAKVRQFLLDRAPASIAVSMSNPRGLPPSGDAIEDWAEYWHAALNPMEVGDSLASITVQQVETLMALYPWYYEKIQGTVLEKIGEIKASGGDIDDTAAMRMELLFNLPGAMSPAFGELVARTVRSWQERQAGQQAGGSSQSASRAAAKRVSRLSPSNPGLTGPTMGTEG
jgi:hypothetical protein